MKPNVVIPAVIVVLAAVAGYAYYEREQEQARLAAERLATAKAQCNEWADLLDSQTTAAGVYIRWEGDTLPAPDPWGNMLRVLYSQGGLAELVEVRSLGPDGVSHTADDIVAARSAVNFKGVGEGIKTGAEETARNAASGAVKGAVDGVKDVLGLGKPKDQKAEPKKP